MKVFQTTAVHSISYDYYIQTLDRIKLEYVYLFNPFQRQCRHIQCYTSYNNQTITRLETFNRLISRKCVDFR